MRCASSAQASGASSHDLVLRLRPDLCFCGALDLAPMLKLRTHHPSREYVWLPWWSPRPGWAFDQIAAGSEAAMKAYATGYQRTVRRLVDARSELYPEAVMWEHLTTAGSPRLTPRPIRGFRASLARERPSANLIDPFTKIKEDLASGVGGGLLVGGDAGPTRSWSWLDSMGPPPPYACSHSRPAMLRQQVS